MGPVVMLYVIGTFAAALLAVVASFMFPVTLQLTGTPEAMAAPGGLGEVVKNILLKLVDNPANAIAEANYIGILAWAIAFGLVVPSRRRRRPRPSCRIWMPPSRRS